MIELEAMGAANKEGWEQNPDHPKVIESKKSFDT